MGGLFPVRVRPGCHLSSAMGLPYLRQQTLALEVLNSRLGPLHKVAALQPAARGQEPRGRKPAERTALAGLRAPS